MHWGVPLLALAMRTQLQHSQLGCILDYVQLNQYSKQCFSEMVLLHDAVPAANCCAAASTSLWMWMGIVDADVDVEIMGNLWFTHSVAASWKIVRMRALSSSFLPCLGRPS
jgi:hypothetical protein